MERICCYDCCNNLTHFKKHIFDIYIRNILTPILIFFKKNMYKTLKFENMFANEQQYAVIWSKISLSATTKI